MKLITLFLCLFFCLTQAFGQTKSVLVEIKVESISYRMDTLKLNPQTNIRLNRVGCSPITSVGIVKGTEFGMQIEILKSKLAGKDHFVVGKAFFIKRNGRWEFIHQDEHHDISSIVSTVLTNQGLESFSVSGTGTYDPEFYITFLERYTLVK